MGKFIIRCHKSTEHESAFRTWILPQSLLSWYSPAILMMAKTWEIRREMKAPASLSHNFAKPVQTELLLEICLLQWKCGTVLATLLNIKFPCVLLTCPHRLPFQEAISIENQAGEYRGWINCGTRTQLWFLPTYIPNGIYLELSQVKHISSLCSGISWNRAHVNSTHLESLPVISIWGGGTHS